MNNHALAFFTFCDNCEENHSRSRRVIQVFKQGNHHAFLLKSIAEGRLMRRRPVMIALFDADCVGALWLPRERTDPGVPLWAYELSTGPCIAVCQESCPSRVEEAASEILNAFLRSHEHNQHNDPERYRRHLVSVGEYHERPRERSLRHSALRHLKQF